MGPRLLLLALLASAIVVSGRVARAQQPSGAAEARALFEQGLRYTDGERWGEALEYFRRSRALVERPNTVFNIGNALVRLGRPTEAIAALEDFLRLADPQRDARRRAEASEMLVQARAAVAHVALALAPASAELRVDGVVAAGAGEHRELALDPGARVLEASAPGHASRSLTLSLLPGAHEEQTLHLVPLAPPPEPPRSVLPTPPRVVDPAPRPVEPRSALRRDEERSRSGGLLASPVFWAVAGAALVGAVVLGVALASGSDAPYGGSTGSVLQGATFAR